jgi:predicted dehydrogenase
MGKRRISLIKKTGQIEKIYGIDNIPERREECEKIHGIKTYSELDNLLGEVEISSAFVCTAPVYHSELISQCLKKGLHVFTELNLISDGYDKNIMLAKKQNVTLFLSSTFLYRKEIKKIKSILSKTDCLLNYTYHIGQYLPDWHPWENYQDFFVNDRRTNGCREIFAIELPWITDIFGDIINTQVVKSKMSRLTLEYNDNYLVLTEHQTGHKGMLAVDVVSRKPVRNLEIFGEDVYISWDGSPEGLSQYDYIEKNEYKVSVYDKADQLENYSKFIVENAYYDEIISFFSVINHEEKMLYSFEKDRAILEIIDKIEA